MMMLPFSVSLASSCGSDQLSWCPCQAVVRVSLVEPTVCGRLGRTAGTNGKSYLGHPSEGACSGFFSSALPHKDLAGISAACGFWDNSSGQQHFSKCAQISVLQHANRGWIEDFARAKVKFIQAAWRRPRSSYPLLVIVHFIILAVQSRDFSNRQDICCPQHHKKPEKMANFFSTFGGVLANIFLEEAVFF